MKAAQDVLAKELHDAMSYLSITNTELIELQDEVITKTLERDDLLKKIKQLKDALSALEKYSKPAAFHENPDDKKEE